MCSLCIASLRGRIRVAALEHIPGRNRVQAPAAPGFYRSCADALTDGFCPQSGLVQRECFMLPVGSAPFGGWRHHLPSHFVVGLWMLGSGVKVSLWQQRRENHTTGLRPEENKPTALTGDGNTPLSPPAAVLLLKGSMSLDSQSSTTPYESSSFATPEGEVLAALCF